MGVREERSTYADKNVRDDRRRDDAGAAARGDRVQRAHDLRGLGVLHERQHGRELTLDERRIRIRVCANPH